MMDGWMDGWKEGTSPSNISCMLEEGKRGRSLEPNHSEDIFPERILACLGCRTQWECQFSFFQFCRGDDYCGDKGQTKLLDKKENYSNYGIEKESSDVVIQCQAAAAIFTRSSTMKNNL
jgi:hypothetical protein